MPLIKAAAGVIIRNPFAGAFTADLSPLTAPSAAIGHALGKRAVDLLGGRPVESYGKGGIVGTAGEQEHVVACVTTTFAIRSGKRSARRCGLDLVGHQGGLRRHRHRHSARPQGRALHPLA
ncbi:MAG: amino acid synthesis family protein [Paracoccaceae bacterium]